jgi:hypothetical protein
MKKYIISGIAVLAIAAVAAWNVSVNSQNSALSDIQLANVEALAQESTSGYTEIRDETSSYSNGNLYRQSVIISCHTGGPLTSCNSSCKYRIKNENGSWTSWMYC